jgi:hypothetical protein
MNILVQKYLGLNMRRTHARTHTEIIRCTAISLSKSTLKQAEAEAEEEEEEEERTALRTPACEISSVCVKRRNT